MRFEFYKDKSKEWRWRIVSRNGKTIADSAEGYERKLGCQLAIHRVQRQLGKVLEVREVKQ